MIVRLWHGRTSLSKADEYAEFMKKRAAPDYASIKGLKKLYFLRRNDGDAAHFLLEKEETSALYEVFFEK